MTDSVLEFNSSGQIDPDEILVRDGLADPQTGRTKSAVAVSARSRAAAALRIAGAPYADIAETLEYAAPAEARKAVEEVLAENVDETKDYQALRALTSLRLEGLLAAVYPAAIDPSHKDQLWFHRAALSVIDRLARLHGLDAPQRVALITPASEEFERVVALMMSASPVRTAAEADIFQLEAAPVEWSEEDGQP